MHCPKLSQNQLWMTYPASVCDWWKQISYNWETPLQLGVKEEHFTQMQWLLHTKPPVSKWGQKRGKVQWAPELASTLSTVGTVSCCADSSAAEADSTGVYHLTEVDCTELLILILNRNPLQLNAFTWKNTLHVNIYFCHIFISALHFRLSKRQLLKWMKKELRLQQQVGHK